MHIDTTSVLIIVILAYAAWRLIVNIIVKHKLRSAEYFLQEVKCAESKFVAEHGEGAMDNAQMFLSPKAYAFLKIIARGHKINAEVDPKLEGIQCYLVKTGDEKVIGFRNGK